MRNYINKTSLLNQLNNLFFAIYSDFAENTLCLRIFVSRVEGVVYDLGFGGADDGCKVGG